MKSILVGFDAFDPVFFERLNNEGKTPNLKRFVESGGYSPFRVTNPPQSEVSWTSIATGMNPGGHGIFDFVHRNPATYGLYVSLLPTKSGLLGTQFTPPYDAETIFSAAVKDGYQSTSLWWPATFPARLQSPIRTIPGLGTPDIFGQLGVGISYSMEALTDENHLKTRTSRLSRHSSGVYRGTINGPVQKNRSNEKSTSLDFELSILDKNSAKLIFEKQTLELVVGQWSPIVEIKFKVGFMVSLKMVTRVILTQVQPDPVLYFLPLQLHPLSSPWPYGTPKIMLKNLWKNQGPFLTMGWPQDTIALEEGFINDEQFLDLCDQIFKQRENIFVSMLNSFNEGVLGCVFDSLDRVQHMFWKNRPDVIEEWYLKLDGLAGRIETNLKSRPGGEKIKLCFVSDHGFQDFDYKVNINRWLHDQGYLKLEDGSDSSNLSAVEWSQSQAYAIGLNSIYLNLQGREGHGTIKDSNKAQVLTNLKDELLQWRGPDGGHVIQNIYNNEEVFSGPLAEYGPDFVVGYAPKYRASSETGLGGLGDIAIENNSDHWEADHCIDAEAVPGVLFSDRGLENFPNPSYQDIPAMMIDKELIPRISATPVGNDEDQEALEERLKGLGYL
ncbi:alkaline phosphatase family protein [Chloroflexota bacterium]